METLLVETDVMLFVSGKPQPITLVIKQLLNLKHALRFVEMESTWETMLAMMEIM
jgi:hypothetical protein